MGTSPRGRAGPPVIGLRAASDLVALEGLDGLVESSRCAAESLAELLGRCAQGADRGAVPRVDAPWADHRVLDLAVGPIVLCVYGLGLVQRAQHLGEVRWDRVRELLAHGVK